MLKVCVFEAPDQTTGVGRVDGDEVVRVSGPDAITYLDRGGTDLEQIALRDVKLLPPVLRPPTIRDFYSFHGHATAAMAARGRQVPQEWFDAPRFYFSNPASLVGHEGQVNFPIFTSERDYEVELAAVIGTDGDIAGFTIMNDWSARDLQREEMVVGLGPCKGKDFGTSLGPWLVAIDRDTVGTGLEMVARVNGEERSRGNTRAMFHSWDSIVRYAARGTRLLPGDILASGTMDGGCILEHGDGRWLQPGDVVELEIENIGILRNRVGRSAPNELRATSEFPAATL